MRFALGMEFHDEDDTDVSGLNILALMFRKIKGDLNISSRVWSTMMTRYLKDPRNEVTQTSRGRSSERSNLTRALGAPGMTFKNFVKGIRLLDPKEVQLILELEFPDETRVRHTTTINQEALYMHFHNEKYPERQNVLATMFRAVKNVMGIGEEKWRELMQAYLDNPANGFVELYEAESGVKTKVTDSGKRSSERSNLTRGLGNPDMTIRVFTKGLKVLNPTNIHLTTKLDFGNGRTSSHTVSVVGSALVAVGDD
jgi:hypothetical protein